MRGGGKVEMHTGYVLLSNEPNGKRKLMCSEEGLPVMHDSLLCGHSLYMKVKAATASRIACISYPLVLVHSLRRISSVPEHQPGRVMTSLLFKRSVKIAEHCSEYESFTSPSATTYATGDPVATCGFIPKALNPAPLWGPLTPFESPKRACCLLQKREAPVFPLGKSSSTSFWN